LPVAVRSVLFYRKIAFTKVASKDTFLDELKSSYLGQYNIYSALDEARSTVDGSNTKSKDGHSGSGVMSKKGVNNMLNRFRRGVIKKADNNRMSRVPENARIF